MFDLVFALDVISLWIGDYFSLMYMFGQLNSLLSPVGFYINQKNIVKKR